MLLIMVVTLYISRIILAMLGVEDYGVFNVVGGVVVLFTFLNTSMISTTQRFLNFEMGRCNGGDSIRNVFSMCFNCHLLIVALILFLGETIGLWIVNSFLNIPEERIDAANWVYQFSLLTTCIQVISAPYIAAIISCEKMSIYAYISIIDVGLKFVAAFSIVLISFDRLIFYGLFLSIVALTVFLCYFIYCLSIIPFCRYKLFWNTTLFKTITSFSGWSLLGGASNIGEVQGINIIINKFFGVAINAAMGIANQVTSALTMFVNNFATAFNPQIIKTFSAGEMDNFYKLLHTTSRFCYLLYFSICLPVFFYCDTILQIWLKDVPDNATLFCRLVILVSLVDSINTPLWTAVRAHGNIKKYNIVTSFLRLSALPICYIGFIFGMSPEFALITNLCLNIIIQSWVLFHIKNLVALDIHRHMKEAIFPCLMVSLLCIPVPIILRQLYYGFWADIMSLFVVGFLTVTIVISIGITKYERSIAFNFIISKFIKTRVKNENNIY